METYDNDSGISLATATLSETSPITATSPEPEAQTSTSLATEATAEVASSDTEDMSPTSDSTSARMVLRPEFANRSPRAFRTAIHRPEEGQFEFHRPPSIVSSEGYDPLELPKSQDVAFLAIRELIESYRPEGEYVPRCLQRASFTPEEATFLHTTLGKNILLQATKLALRVQKAWCDMLRDFNETSDVDLKTLNDSFPRVAQELYTAALSEIREKHRGASAERDLIVAVYRKTIRTLAVPVVDQAAYARMVYDDVARGHLATNTLVSNLADTNEDESLPPMVRFEVSPAEYISPVSSEAGDFVPVSMSDASHTEVSRSSASSDIGAKSEGGVLSDAQQSSWSGLEDFDLDDAVRVNQLNRVMVSDMLNRVNQTDDSSSSSIPLIDFQPLSHWDYHDANGMTLLGYAVLAGNSDAVHGLLQRGADWDYQVKSHNGDMVPLLELTNVTGNSLLHLLVKAGYHDWATTILSSLNKLGPCLMLINDEGFRPAELIDVNGSTLLHHVTAMGDDSLAYQLIVYGANPKLPNTAGQTAEQMVKDRPKPIGENIASNVKMNLAQFQRVSRHQLLGVLGGADDLALYQPSSAVLTPYSMSRFRQMLWFAVRNELVSAMAKYEGKKNSILQMIIRFLTFSRLDSREVEAQEQSFFEMVRLISEPEGDGSYADNALYNRLSAIAASRNQKSIFEQVWNVFLEPLRDASAGDFIFAGNGPGVSSPVETTASRPERPDREALKQVKEPVEAENEQEEHEYDSALEKGEAEAGRADAAEKKPEQPAADADETKAAIKAANARAEAAEKRSEAAEKRSEAAEASAAEARAEVKLANASAADANAKYAVLLDMVQKLQASMEEVQKERQEERQRRERQQGGESGGQDDDKGSNYGEEGAHSPRFGYGGTPG